VDEQRRKGASRTQGRNFGSWARFVVRGENSDPAVISDHSKLANDLKLNFMNKNLDLRNIIKRPTEYPAKPPAKTESRSLSTHIGIASNPTKKLKTKTNQCTLHHQYL
jgi:hypothetical protein